jgi:small conductance mechanosensitive channel
METAVIWISHTGWKIFTIIGICFGAYMVIRRFAPLTIRRTVKREMKRKPKVEREKRVQTLVRLTTTVSAIGLGILATFFVLQQLGINMTTPLVGLGVFGVAVGFGAQYLIRDLIAGFFVYLENQYNVGDVIRTGDVAGIVEELSLRRTILRDLDGARHTIPNGEVRIVSNLTQEWSRAHLNINVAYKEDLDKVMALMRQTWEEMKQDPNWGPDMLSETPWLLRVDEFGSSGITIKMVGETRPIKQWDVMGEFRRRIKKVFDEEGIEIPWPHTKVYFGNPPNSPKLDSK